MKWDVELLKRFFKQLLLNFYILMSKLMLSYFVADILGIYFYFFHIVQDDHILGFIHLKYTKVKNIRNTSFSEKERAQIIIILIATLY